MTIECPHCKNIIFPTHLSKELYISMGEKQGNPLPQELLSNLVALNGNKLKDLVCPKCNRKVRITPDNLKSFQSEDFQKLGIFWTVFCNNCKHIVEPLPLKKDYGEVACPVCRKRDGLSHEFVWDYLGGYDNVGLSGNEIDSKNYYFFIKSLLTFCCSKAANFNENDRMLIDDLIDCLSAKALRKEGEIDLQLIQTHWQDIAGCFEKLRDKAEQIGIISTEGIKKTRGEWNVLVGAMAPNSGESVTTIDAAQVGTINNVDESNGLPMNKVVQDMLSKFKENPELTSLMKTAVQELGADPIPKIMNMVISSPDNQQVITMASLCLFHIGQSAIPHLIDLLGHDNYKVAAFAAKTISGFDGALPYVIKCLRNDNADIRLHACGALQGYGPEAKEAIPDLCQIIRKEPKSDVAGIASGVLGRIGEAAVPALTELSRNNDRDVRMAVIATSIKLGDKAIPILYEMRVGEKDDDLLKMIDGVGNKILRGGPDEMILPRGIAGSMVGLINGTRMNSHQIELHMWERFKKEADTSVHTLLKKVEKATIGSQNIASILMNEVGERGISSLIKLLGSEDRNVGAIAGDTLAAIGLPSIPYLITALKSENIDTRTGATGALLRIARNGFGPRTRDVITALSELIRTEKTDLFDIALLAARALAETGDEAVPTLRELLKTKKFSARLAVVAAFYWIGGQPSRSILQEARKKEINFGVLEGIDYALQEMREKRKDNTHISTEVDNKTSSLRNTDAPRTDNSISAKIKRLFKRSH